MESGTPETTIGFSISTELLPGIGSVPSFWEVRTPTRTSNGYHLQPSNVCIVIKDIKSHVAI